MTVWRHDSVSRVLKIVVEALERSRLYDQRIVRGGGRTSVWSFFQLKIHGCIGFEGQSPFLLLFQHCIYYYEDEV